MIKPKYKAFLRAIAADLISNVLREQPFSVVDHIEDVLYTYLTPFDTAIYVCKHSPNPDAFFDRGYTLDNPETAHDVIIELAFEACLQDLVLEGLIDTHRLQFAVEYLVERKKRK